MLDSLMAILKDFWFWVVNSGIQFLAIFMDTIADLLPACTPDWGFVLDIPDAAASVSGYFGHVLGFIAWLFPIEALATSLAFIVCNLTFYFTVGILLRWAKIVSS